MEGAENLGGLGRCSVCVWRIASRWPFLAMLSCDALKMFLRDEGSARKGDAVT
jgi:hypothetical protein